MKNQKFRFRKLITFLAFVMLLSAFGALSFSANAEEICGDFLYELNYEGYAEITGYIGKNKNEVVIPSDVDGYEVKAVRNFDLYGKNVNRVVISEGIETIKMNAFRMGYGDSISEIVFPASLKNIEDFAFSEQESLYRCEFKEGLESIGENAFYNCPLEQIELPDSVTEIGSEAFSGNKAKELTLNENLETVGMYAFYSDTLETVTYSCNNLSIDSRIFGYTVKNVIVSEGVTNVVDNAFDRCNLISVKLPSTLVKIGNAAFRSSAVDTVWVNTLKKVIIPPGVKVIGSDAFHEDTVIYGQKGSVANRYASTYGNKFINNDVSLMTYYYKTEWAYTGEEICPDVTVTNLGYNPTYNTDYTLSYSDNVKIGTGKITVKGKGDFIGQKVLNFRIGYDIANAKITLSKAPYIYSPNGVFPSVTVKYGKKTLSKGTDYTVTYTNNKAIGVATLTVKGIGSYVGSVSKSFTVIPGNVSGFKVSSRTASTLTLKWNKVNGADGYAIYLYNASKGTYAYKASVKGTSYTAKKLKAGTKYTYAVKAYKDIKKSRYTSNSLTTLTTSTAPSKPTLQVSVGKAKATLSWKKGTCSGYEIYMKSGNGSYKKIATLKGSSKVSYTKSKLTTGKTYSFKVRAFTTVNGKNVYGDYSAVKSVKIK